MKRQWSLDDLIEYFTLLPYERQLIAPLRTDYTRLGFAVLLKCFLLDGRFPQSRMDAPTSVVAFLAKQLGLDPVVYAQYDWRGRSSEEHRAQIRALLGFREATVQDSDDVAGWLTAQLLQTHDTDVARRKATVYARFRALQVEPPTPDRVEHMVHSALALKRELGERWSMTSLLDMFKEADLRVSFTDVFKSLTVREHLDRATLQHRLLLCLYGLGTNTGLKRMSVGNPHVSYKDLLYVRRRFIVCDHLRNAITQVTDATFRARRTDIWGEITTTCASDAKKFGAWDQNLITEWHTRYQGRGVVIYWHVEKKSACIYSQLKSCSASEVAAAITGVIRHCTAMSVNRHYVDSHGQSAVHSDECACGTLSPPESDCEACD